MWVARGSRLWRSSWAKLRHPQGTTVAPVPGSSSSQHQYQQQVASLLDSSSLSRWSLATPRSESAGVAAVAAGSRRDVCGNALVGLQQQQQRMGFLTSSECLRSASDSDKYTPSAQKEPLLRPKEADVEDEIDDEPLEEDAGEITSESPQEELSSLERELQNAPRRRQRFILQNALKVRNIESEGRPRKPGFTMKVVDVNRTCKVTKGGGILNFTALVICGNGDGVAGFGKGKSAEISAAVDKAYARALRNLHYFERFDGHTIFHEKNSKYGQTKIYLWPAQSGTGMRASHTVGGILRLAGFKNVKSKVVGSRHPHNTVKAVFQALSEIESPDEKAEREGRQRVTRHG